MIKIVTHGFKHKSGPTEPYMNSKTNWLDLFVIVVMLTSYVLPVDGELAAICIDT